MKFEIKGTEHISEEIKQQARIGMDKYRAWRGLISAIERLDCVEDADLIAAIARTVPHRPAKRVRRS